MSKTEKDTGVKVTVVSPGVVKVTSDTKTDRSFIIAKCGKEIVIEGVNNPYMLIEVSQGVSAANAIRSYEEQKAIAIQELSKG